MAFAHLMTLPALHSGVVVLVGPRRAAVPRTAPFRIVVISSRPLVQHNIHRLLRLSPNFRIITRTNSNTDTVSLTGELSVSIVLLSLGVGNVDNLSALGTLHESNIATRVVVLAMSSTSDSIFTLVSTNTSNCLLGSDSPRMLLRTVHTKTGNDGIFDRHIGRCLHRHRVFNTRRSPFDILARHRLSILRRLTRKLSGGRVTSILGVSRRAMGMRVHGLLHGLGIHSHITTAVLFLRRHKTRWG